MATHNQRGILFKTKITKRFRSAPSDVVFKLTYNFGCVKRREAGSFPYFRWEAAARPHDRPRAAIFLLHLDGGAGIDKFLANRLRLFLVHALFHRLGRSIHQVLSFL